LWSKIAQYYFSHEEARELSREYYQELEQLTKEGKHDESIILIRKFGIASAKVWEKVRADLPVALVE